MTTCTLPDDLDRAVDMALASVLEPHLQASLVEAMRMKIPHEAILGALDRHDPEKVEAVAAWLRVNAEGMAS